mgnify:FL=1
MNAAKQPWIHSAPFDSLFLLAPPLLTTLVVALCSRFFETRGVSLGWWIALVLCVDVAHVYASIYRSYLHPKAFLLRRQLFLAVPLACWAGGVMLYSVRASFFWTALAYLAVFHFVRQQYGFLRLYSRNQKTSLLDQSVIYR